MSGPHHPRAWAAIDLLRFGCALLVVAHHYLAALPLRPNPAAAGALDGAMLSAGLAPWGSFGWIGVEIFFVISGYVIAASAEGAAPRAFLRRRAQRLLPAAWVCATISFAALAALAALPLGTLAGQWLRSVSFWPIGSMIDPSYWTLAIEAAFYAAVAFRLRGGATRGRIEGLAWGIGAASAVFWLTQLGIGSLDGLRMNDRLLQLLLFVHGAFFAIGALLYAVHRDGLTVRRAVGLTLFLCIAGLEITAHARDMAQDLSASPLVPVLLFAAGVAMVALCRRIQPWLNWTGGQAATLGLMTYPLYLLHQQMGAVGAGLFARAGAPADLGLWTAFFAVLALSWAVVRYAEPPLRRLIGSAFSARRDPLPDSLPSASPSGG
jgi:peptidoglycan/LPS O-acetylase OafA/YrhL